MSELDKYLSDKEHGFTHTIKNWNAVKFPWYMRKSTISIQPGSMTVTFRYHWIYLLWLKIRFIRKAKLKINIEW